MEYKSLNQRQTCTNTSNCILATERGQGKSCCYSRHVLEQELERAGRVTLIGAPIDAGAQFAGGGGEKEMRRFGMEC